MQLPTVIVSSELTPSGSALGQHSVTVLHDGDHLLCERADRLYASATVYAPSAGTDLPAIVFVPGWGCGEHSLAAWGPFLASHGFLVMTIGVWRPFHHFPLARSEGLLDAVKALRLASAQAAEGSALAGRVDASRVAVAGWSLGGFACQLAALKDPSLKCVVSLSPMPLGVRRLPKQHTAVVPTLVITGQWDLVALPCLAWKIYRAVGAPKCILEVRRGDHAAANGPAGGCLCDVACCHGACAGCQAVGGLCWCGAGETSPCGTYDRPTGHARADAKRAEIGGLVLRWLRHFVLDQTAAEEEEGEGEAGRAERLRARPSIASGFACDNLEMERATRRA